MNRKDFFKNACKAGICGCAGIALLSPSNLLAAEDSTNEEKPDWRIGFMQKRFARFIEIMNSNLDDETKNKLIEELGRACANEGYKDLLKYKGKIKEFLKDIETKWVEKTEFDEEKKEIRIIDKKRESCFCPFVDMSKMSKDFCNCSIGWQKETYETILGVPVDVKIESSVLRGSDKCSFIISF